MELCKSARRVREEHESETAHHGIEAASFETEGLPVFDHHRCVRQARQALPCPIRHGFPDVSGCDMAAGADNGESVLGCEACTGRNVEHPLARLKTGGPQ